MIYENSNTNLIYNSLNNKIFFLFLFFILDLKYQNKFILRNRYNKQVGLYSIRAQRRSKAEVNLLNKVSNTKKSKKKSKFSNLTKRQRKKLRMRKANRVIQSRTKTFVKFGPLMRSGLIHDQLTPDTYKMIHDGYSWVKVLITQDILDQKPRIGLLAFKTRPLSIVKFSEKGADKINMAQPSTYKIKTPKVKRKK